MGEKVNIDMGFVLETLHTLPNTVVDHVESDGRLILRLGSVSVEFQVLIGSSGYPRDVQNVISETTSKLRLTGKSKGNYPLLFTAPLLTQNSRELLQQAGIGYLDHQGHLFLTAKNLYVLREAEGVQKKLPAKAGEMNLFRGRPLQVLHALLHQPDRDWHVTDLAVEAMVVSRTALNVCETLEKMSLMTREGRGPKSLRRLEKPGDLLDLWAANHLLETYRTHLYYRWASDLSEIARWIGGAADEQGVHYSLTLAMGAMYRAPLLTHTEQIALFVSRTTDLAELAKRCRLDPVEEGSNVVLYVDKFDYPLMYRQKIEGIWVANDVQLYLDLLNSPTRGKEQAEHLRRERIPF